jgi:hypothetical protein
MDIAKLPKWAQARIAVLERELRACTEERDAARATIAGDSTSIYAVRRLGGGSDRIAGATCALVMPGENRDLRVRWDEEDEVFDVNCDGGVAIEPRASNAFRIRVVR